MTVQDSLECFGGYTKGMELFHLVVRDMEALHNRRECFKLVAQQLASADSICANIDEGYGRGSP